MSITGNDYDSPVGVSGQESAGSSDQATTWVLNLGYPLRTTGDAPWTLPPKPLVIRPTYCTRYEQPFIYTNNASGLVGHQSTTSGGGVFEFEVLRWLKQAISLHSQRQLRKLRRKIILVKANFSVSPLLRRRA